MQRLSLHQKMTGFSPFVLSTSLDVSERTLRRVCAWLILAFLVCGELGLGWDIQWHALVGRDRFWTPPHILIYLAVAGAGLTSLFLMLADTLRYRRRVPGVHERSTIGILRVFHGPLGFLLCGLGPLICAIAAPLDNYWHQLYGIDINLWSPFHFMGALGGMITGFGLVYAFASEAVIERRAWHRSRTFLGLNSLEWGALLILSALLRLTLSALTQFPSFAIGPVVLLTYPLPLILGAGICYAGALNFTRKPGTATLLGLLMAAHTLLTEAFVPWALGLMVSQMDLTYRFPGRLPFFNAPAALLSLIFVAAGIIIDLAVVWKRHSGRRKNEASGPARNGYHGGKLSLLAILPIMLGVPLILAATSGLLPAGVIYMQLPTLSSLIVTLPLVIVAGWFAGKCGAWLGKMWYENRR